MWPEYDKETIDDISKMLESGKVNQWTGTKVKEFEKEFAKYFNCKYAVAVSNGTTALELAFITLNLKEGDEVLVTPRSFIASISSIVRCGGIPVFIDVDDTQNINPNNLKVSEKTKGILCVHLAGYPCDMDPIMEFANKHNLWVVEDCAQSTGAKYNGKYCGTIGHINAWSFCQDKIISTGGEGGMITTDDETLYKKAWSFKDHGKDFDLVTTSQTNSSTFRWLHTQVGTNWRMMEFQAIIGLHQLKKLESWVNHRRKISQIYTDYLKDVAYIPEVPDKYYHAFYKFYCFHDKKEEIMKKIQEKQIPVYQGTCGEMYLEKGFTKYEPETPCSHSRELSRKSLMFLTDPTISEETAENNAKIIKKIMEEYK